MRKYVATYDSCVNLLNCFGCIHCNIVWVQMVYNYYYKLIHRLEEALDIQSDLIFVNGMAW